MLPILYFIAMYLRNNMIFSPIIVPATTYKPPSLWSFLNYLHTADFNLYLYSLRIYLVLFLWDVALTDLTRYHTLEKGSHILQEGTIVLSSYC